MRIQQYSGREPDMLEYESLAISESDGRSTLDHGGRRRHPASDAAQLLRFRTDRYHEQSQSQLFPSQLNRSKVSISIITINNMAYNNVNQASGATVPEGGPSMPSTTTRDPQTGQPMTCLHSLLRSPYLTASLTLLLAGIFQAPDPHPKQANTTAEDKVQQEGHMPGLASVQKDNEQDVRQPGEEDAAGNKIQHKGIMKKLFHWEHSGMNAE
ncbi:MAG: hypothetical protein Q9204_007446 [Flavoplaca sp. TL-2023a]